MGETHESITQQCEDLLARIEHEEQLLGSRKRIPFLRLGMHIRTSVAAVALTSRTLLAYSVITFVLWAMRRSRHRERHRTHRLRGRAPRPTCRTAA